MQGERGGERSAATVTRADYSSIQTTICVYDVCKPGICCAKGFSQKVCVCGHCLDSICCVDVVCPLCTGLLSAGGSRWFFPVDDGEEKGPHCRASGDDEEFVGKICYVCDCHTVEGCCCN